MPARAAGSPCVDRGRSVAEPSPRRTYPAHAAGGASAAIRARSGGKEGTGQALDAFRPADQPRGRAAGGENDCLALCVEPRNLGHPEEIRLLAVLPGEEDRRVVRPERLHHRVHGEVD